MKHRFPRRRFAALLLAIPALVGSVPAAASAADGSHDARSAAIADEGAADGLTTRAAAGSAWSSVGRGFSTGVHSIAVSGTNLYAGGHFGSLCPDAACSPGGRTVNRVAKWNGTSWSAMGHGFSDRVEKVVVIGGEIFAAGWFRYVCGNEACNSGNVRVNHIARWDGAAWRRVGHGFASWRGVVSIKAIVSGPTGIVVGGAFDTACGNPDCNAGNTLGINNVAAWDRSTDTWSGLGMGVGSSGQNGGINAMVRDAQSRLVVAGTFQGICSTGGCSVPAANRTNNVARWTGTAWEPVGFGLMGWVDSLAYGNVGLVAGGVIPSACGNQACDAGNQPMNAIARFTGSGWSPLSFGLGLGQSAGVRAVLVAGSTVYAAGQFTRACPDAACSAGGTTLNRVGVWNGTAWARVGNGLSGDAYALARANGILYVGGYLDGACGNAGCTTTSTPLRHIAAYGATTGGCSSSPAAPTLHSPAHGATVGSRRPTLRWNAATCAGTYRVTVKDMAGATVDAARDLAALTYRTDALAAGSRFRWSVRACNDVGCTASVTRAFVTP